MVLELPADSMSFANDGNADIGGRWDQFVTQIANDMNVGCRLCIAMHLCAIVLTFGTCHYCPRRYGVCPFAMRPFCASQVTGGFFTFHTQTEDSSTYR